MGEWPTDQPIDMGFLSLPREIQDWATRVAGRPSGGSMSPHEPSPECGDDHCYSHNIDEPFGPNSYRVCGECGHVFDTAEDLIEDFNSEMPEGLPPEVDVQKINFCPWCTHDF